MARKKPTPDPPKTTVAARREKARYHEDIVTLLRLQGVSQQAIADRIGLSRTGVRKVWERVEKRVLARSEKRVRLLKGRQELRLEHLISEAAAAYERSKRPGRKRRVKTITVQIGTGPETAEQPGRETTREVTGRDGDPRWLDTILKAMADQRRLWRIGDDDDQAEDLDDIQGLADEYENGQANGTGEGDRVLPPPAQPA